MNLSDVLNGCLCIQQPVPACGLIHGCVTMLSDNQGCDQLRFPLRSHPIIASQWMGIQHSQCIQLRMLLAQR